MKVLIILALCAALLNIIIAIATDNISAICGWLVAILFMIPAALDLWREE